MYLQSGKSKSRIRGAQRQSGNERTLLSRLPGILKVLVFFAIVAGICNAYIYLNQQRNNTARSISKLRTELIRIENETINERNHGERLRDWSHIQAQIKRYQLPLELPDRGQRRQIALLTPQQASRVNYQAAAGPAVNLTSVASATVPKSRSNPTAAAPVLRTLPTVSAAVTPPTRHIPAKKTANIPVFGRGYRVLSRQK